MVAILVTEDQDGRGGALNADDRSRKYTRRFSVYVNNALDGPRVAVTALGIPRLWTPYVSGRDIDVGSWCRELTPEPTDSPYLWKVTARYSNVLTRPDQQQTPPEQRPVQVSFHTTRIATPLVVDADGKKVLNSAGDVYDPPLEFDEKVLVIRIVRNQIRYDAVFANEFQDSLNTRRFYGFKRGSVRCVEISADYEFESGIYFWKVTYQFEARRERIPPNAVLVNDEKVNKRRSEAWTRWVLDRGFRTGDGKPCVDRFKVPLTTPGLLDGGGAQLSFDADPRYRGHRVFPLRDFRRLGLS
jgi:hypothetical protein